MDDRSEYGAPDLQASNLMLNVGHYEMSGAKGKLTPKCRKMPLGKLDVPGTRSLTVNTSFFLTKMN